jgi:hypothetical protein
MILLFDATENMLLQVYRHVFFISYFVFSFHTIENHHLFGFILSKSPVKFSYKLRDCLAHVFLTHVLCFDF